MTEQHPLYTKPIPVRSWSLHDELAYIKRHIDKQIIRIESLINSKTNEFRDQLDIIDERENEFRDQLKICEYEISVLYGFKIITRNIVKNLRDDLELLKSETEFEREIRDMNNKVLNFTKRAESLMRQL
jgi:hypothetical protein